MANILISSSPLKFSKRKFLKMPNNLIKKSLELVSNAFSGEAVSLSETIINVQGEWGPFLGARIVNAQLGYFIIEKVKTQI